MIVGTQTVELDAERFRLFKTIVYYDLLLTLGCILTSCIQQYVALKCARAEPIILNQVASSLQTTIKMIDSCADPSLLRPDRVPHSCSCFRPKGDEWVLQIFSLAWVIKNILFNSTPIAYNIDAQHGARFLCNLISMKHISWFAAFDLESIFWSGIVLARSVDSVGTPSPFYIRG